MTYRLPMLAGTSTHLVGDVRWLDRPGGMDAWELHVTLNGAGLFGRDADAARATRGDLLLFPPGTPHSYGPDPQAGWTYAWVYFHPKPGWQELLAAWPPWRTGVMRLHTEADEFERLSAIFDDLITSSRGQGGRRLEICLNLVERLLLLLDAANPLSQVPVVDDRIEKAMGYIDAHYAEPLTVAGLAKIAFLSPSRFAVLFKEQVGESPMRHLERIRVDRAAEHLLRSDSRVGDVAELTGFNCAFYFSRVFRNRTGMSPREFRRRGGWPKKPLSEGG